jgi:hypothetical protein
MSLQRGCQFCGRRLRGTTPGAMTILIDGQPLDASIVVCGEHALEIRRVLDALRQRSIVAQHARAMDVTQLTTRVTAAPTEQFPAVTAPLSAQLPMPLQRPEQPQRHARRSIWRAERPSH